MASLEDYALPWFIFNKEKYPEPHPRIHPHPKPILLRGDKFSGPLSCSRPLTYPSASWGRGSYPQ